MKKLLLGILVLLAQQSLAQHYNCFVPGAKQYFTNDIGYLKGIRIDSVRSVGDTTLYYPFRSVRGRYDTGSTVVLDSNGASWVGKQVMEHQGTFYFDNIWHDTVVVKTLAVPGDSWTFFKDPSTSLYYKATLASVDTMSFLGHTDSVKNIIITTWYSTTNLVNDSLNGIKLILSKNNGFVQAIDFFTFPYCTPGSINCYSPGRDFYSDFSTTTLNYNYSTIIGGINPNIPSIRNSVFRMHDYASPTYMQLYQWNTGDVYEYSTCYGVKGASYSGGAPPDRYEIDTITGYSLTTGSKNYSFTGTLYSFNGSWWPASSSIISYAHTPNTGIIATGSTYIIDTTLMPEEFGQKNAYYYFPADSIFCSGGALYGIVEGVLDRSTYRRPFENSLRVSIYKETIGLISTQAYSVDAYYYENSRKLFYYNRGSVECRTRITPPTSIADLRINQNKITITPNPASNSINVTNASGISKVSLYNTIGLEVFSHSYNEPSIDIDISNLAPGVYLLKINEMGIRRLIKL